MSSAEWSESSTTSYVSEHDSDKVLSSIKRKCTKEEAYGKTGAPCKN